MSGLNLSQTESYVFKHIRLLDGELSALESHRNEISRLEAQIWSARSDSPAGKAAYGSPNGPYSVSSAGAAAYTPQPSQGLDARLEELRQAESSGTTRISQLVETLKRHGSEALRIRDEVKQDLRILCAQRGELHGEAPAASYHHGENRCRVDLHRCEDVLNRIQVALQRAVAKLTSGPPQPSGSWPATSRSRNLADYVCDGIRNETLYALAMKLNEESDGSPDPPSPHLDVLVDHRTGSLTDKIDAGRGYIKVSAADEYKIPLPQYYYRLYKAD